VSDYLRVTAVLTIRHGTCSNSRNLSFKNKRAINLSITCSRPLSTYFCPSFFEMSFLGFVPVHTVSENLVNLVVGFHALISVTPSSLLILFECNPVSLDCSTNAPRGLVFWLVTRSPGTWSRVPFRADNMRPRYWSKYQATWTGLSQRQ
jgi:hypothetical protein